MRPRVDIPLIVRGRIVGGTLRELDDPASPVVIRSVDARERLSELTLASICDLADLQELRFAEICQYLAKLGERLAFSQNVHLQEAYELARLTSRLPDSVLRLVYDNMGSLFAPDRVRCIAERAIGIAYLDGWSAPIVDPSSPLEVRLRAFGSRCLHVIPGTVPAMSAAAIVHSVICRCDALIKVPANDPLTAVAIARTMMEMDPSHPISRHLAIGFWHSGDEQVEAAVFDTARIDKIIAWGGFNSIASVSRYLRGGHDLIVMDPKQSASLVGQEAFADDRTLEEVAKAIARDIGVFNQECCFSARVVYVVTGSRPTSHADGLRLGRLTYAALQELPSALSGLGKVVNGELEKELLALACAGTDSTVIGGDLRRGAIIVSMSGERVDFHHLLTGRVGNIVLVRDVEQAIASMGVETQSVGVYPRSLHIQLRERLAIQGVQRIVTLGSAANTAPGLGGPQDAIEPVRRMCRWIVDENRIG
jgi:hypothetical protein